MPGKCPRSNSALAGIVISLLTLISAIAVTLSTSNADETTYRPIQAINYVLGSKQAVGYFVSEYGECQLTLMVAEEIDPLVATPLSAARIRVVLRPRQTVILESEERKSLSLTCGNNAETVVAVIGGPQIEIN